MKIAANTFHSILICIILLLGPVSPSFADYQFFLKDGTAFTWQNYTLEATGYCTNKSFGKFCIEKKDVLYVKETKTDSPPPVIINKGTVSVAGSKTVIDRKNSIPVSGNRTPGVEILDEVMLKFMDQTNSSAAALAIGRRGELVHSRGYGWSDKDKTVPMQPNTMMGIASCEKPITAAAIRKLAREGRLKLDARLFEFLKIKPQGQVVDPRIMNITINHLLEHTAGWGSDPVSEAADAARRKGFSNPVPADSRAWFPDSAHNALSMEAFLGFVMTERLKSEPGTAIQYCNFGFDTLRFVVTKVTGRPYTEYFQRELFRPNVVKEFKAHDMPRTKEDSPLVWNAETGGLSASAPALLTFMNSYWLTGEPRDRGNPLWVMYGSLPGSTAIMIWRPDGTDIVALFNSRARATHDEIRTELERALERLKQ